MHVIINVERQHQVPWRVLYHIWFVGDRQVWKWFSMFRFDNTPWRNEPRPRRSSYLELEVLRELMECNTWKSTQEIALNINTSRSIICRHLKKNRKNEQENADHSSIAETLYFTIITKATFSKNYARKILLLGWFVLIHPPHLPAFAPCEFHLFRSLLNDVNDKYKIKFSGSGGNVRVKLLELETNWILLDRNQQVTWLMARRDSK